MDRTIREARPFSKAETVDREDVARLTFAERLAALADLRSVWFAWFGEDQLAERGKIWMLGRKPRRIDVLTQIPTSATPC